MNVGHDVVWIALALSACSRHDMGTAKEQTHAVAGALLVSSEVAHVRTCRATCTTPSDCAVAGQPLGDASHFKCTGGMCEWTGCKSAQDCASSRVTASSSAKLCLGRLLLSAYLPALRRRLRCSGAGAE